MPPQIEIRLATPQDAEAISRILHDSFVEFESQYTPQGFAATTPQPEQILVRMKDGPVWIALDAGTPVGTVAALAKPDSLYMRGMAVLPSARGSRAATQLLTQVEHWAAQHNHSRITLSTTPFLHAAIRFYEKHGFRRIAQGPLDLFDTPLFAMDKKLAPTTRGAAE